MRVLFLLWFYIFTVALSAGAQNAINIQAKEPECLALGKIGKDFMLADTAMYRIDPLKLNSGFLSLVDGVTSSQAWQMTYIGVPLVVGALIIKSEDDHFRRLRNDYLPVFEWHYDDYAQYLPAVVMLGLKAGGVQGRSSWGRMLGADAFSVAIMAGTVNLLKNSSDVERPDGSNRHSFPSGHTATAFMTATMMSKEYGGRSPWYSVGAYTLATATGLTRMANNKHWLSDVLAGAGIGILATELGYFLADLIWKDRGLNQFDVLETFDRMNRPSFFGVYLGLNIMPGSYRLKNNTRLSFSSGSTVGVEGAWFFNPYVGIGGRLSATNLSVILDREALEKSLDWASTSAGAYFSYPLTSRFLAGAKVLAGYSYFAKCKLPSVTIGDQGGGHVGTGCSLTYLAKRNLGGRLFFDYNLLLTDMPVDLKYLQMMTLGCAVTVAF